MRHPTRSFHASPSIGTVPRSTFGPEVRRAGRNHVSTIARQHPYLSGGYAPTANEVEVHDLETIGQLPAALTGRYLRTGPNPIDVPDGPYHWFIGDGMVHGIRLDDGRARSYRNRWVRTDAVADRLGEPRRDGPAQPAVRLEQHQRHGVRRSDPVAHRGLQPVHPERRSRHARPSRLRLAAPARHDRPPEDRSDDRRAARVLLLVGSAVLALPPRQPHPAGSSRRRRSISRHR